MSNIEKKEANLNSESKLKKNIPTLVILTLSGAFVYALPYFRLFYYDAFLDAFNMTNTEAGLCGTFYGALGAISYLIGGFIADRVSVRKLLSISLIATGVTGFYLLTIPSPFIVALIHGLWGVTTIMTFWPALMKAIRLMAASNEQGKAFGFFEGGRGIVNGVYMGLAVVAFGYLTVKGGNTLGIKSLIFAYSLIAVVLGILVLFLLKKEAKTDGESSNNMNFNVVGKVLKMPTTWLMVGIIFCTYSMNMSFYYVSPYTTAAFGASTVFAAALSTMSQYIRPIAAFGAGFLGDKINSSKALLISQFIMLAGIIILLLTPAKPALIYIIIGSCVLIYVSMYASQSMHFAIMEESEYSPEIAGTAIGIICCLGYLPESICPLVAGIFLDKFPELLGYRYYFFLLLGVCIIGIALTFVWLKITREKRAQMLEANKKIKL